VCETLSAVCREPTLHARFLNTLSLMEHIGSRKIMASQPESRLQHDSLKHLAEETRHAYFFKRAAERLALRTLAYDAGDTVAGASARAYMGRLDVGIANELGPGAQALPYLYMSLIIEVRAIWFYRLYQTVLDQYGLGISLKSVLGEEALHLSAMIARLTAMDATLQRRISCFLDLERDRFDALWSAIEADSGRERLAAE